MSADLLQPDWRETRKSANAAAKGWLGREIVPAGFALFPTEVAQPPREWAERFCDAVHWTEMSAGGQ